MSTDRIEKEIILRATRERVWRAISDATEFGQWFGVRFDGPFVEGALVKGRVTPTTADPEIAEAQKAFEGMAFDVRVERVEPMRHLSFRWDPSAELSNDWSKPTTLVSFDLHDAPEGTLLKITESGFDQIPLERRAKVFTENEHGWEMQVVLIQKYLAAHAAV